MRRPPASAPRPPQPRDSRVPFRIRCFMLTPTDEVVVRLRRFASTRDGAPKCGRREPRYPGGEVMTYEAHDVEVEIARETGTLERDIWGRYVNDEMTIDRADPRWPTRCACGYEFTDGDMKQEGRTRLFKRSDTGELVTVGDAPAGALYDSTTFGEVEGYQRKGKGVSLVCKTPAGEWMIDGPASNGPGWTRTGVPPDISVHPSIGIGDPQRMHGWLGRVTPGWLEIDMIAFDLK